MFNETFSVNFKHCECANDYPEFERLNEVDKSFLSLFVETLAVTLVTFEVTGGVTICIVSLFDRLSLMSETFGFCFFKLNVLRFEATMALLL